MSGSKLIIKTNKSVNLIPMTRSTYVGYPEGPDRSDSGISNAELAFIMTEGVRKKSTTPLSVYFLSKGDAAFRIPPRPFVEPGIEKAIERIIPYLRNTIIAHIEGNEGKAEENRVKAGIMGENAVRSFIRDYPNNGLAPNAPSTIKRKGEDHPLKGLTGELMRSVTSVVMQDD